VNIITSQRYFVIRKRPRPEDGSFHFVLKSGSPAVWGGKSKEFEFLLQHGTEVRVISG
jgi:siroheme synthase